MISPAPCVCAVIVTYHPDPVLFAELLAAIAGQVQELVIVDNGSSAARVEALTAFARGSPRRHILPQEGNMGIAAAQNRGIWRALDLRCTHVLLLDHDSIPAADMVRQLLLLESRLLADDIRVGAIGPTQVDRRTFTRAGFVRRQQMFIRRRYPCRVAGYVETDFLISSGMLIRAPALRAIGVMNSGYFIDHVDTEWCFRATHLGYRLFGAQRAVLHHTLGYGVIKIWLGRWREVPQHSPLRNYYIFRNTLKMVRRTPMTMAWRLAHLYRLGMFLCFFLIVGKPRAQRLRMMLLGIRDGIKGVEGMIDSGKITLGK
ncbi:rhamnosyltransferase [Acerihabitans arboris]|uniref:Rhamnosyltransferase n=1 Tax=Acerihabitans arboris TaxID=2691583 RepID=A0A845SS08_9GAMM|nr:rhamnosyltransferase [Acerihabitans arboris]NDL65646.1 rhamnosyltransferase [Acerihabitans arboris]